MKQKHQFGAVVVVCSSQINKPDSDPVIVIINNYTTSNDLIDLVLTRCKARCLDASDFCITMETGPKGGPRNTQVLKGVNRPLEMQATMPKGQTRFGVQPRSGVIVKVYDTRVWPVEPLGDLYISPDDTTHQTLSHLLTPTTTKKKVAKLSLALGNSSGKVYQFLTDESKPLSDYTTFTSTADPAETCLLIVKKVKPAKKLMFRSLSWASLTHSDTLKSTLDRKLKKSKKKQKDLKVYPTFPFDETGDPIVNATTDNLCPSAADEQAGFTDSVNVKVLNISSPSNRKSRKSAKLSPQNKSATCPRGRPPSQNLATSFSCENIFSSGVHDRPKLCIKPELQTAKTPKDVPQTGAVSSVEEDNLNVTRCRSLGDISMGANLSLPAPTSSTVDYQNVTGVDMYNPGHQASFVSESASNITLRGSVDKSGQNIQSRNSCVARMYENSSSIAENYTGATENYPVMENYTGQRVNSAAESEPRMRRTLPQIPNDIDIKKKRFADLMKRRLTVCGGEIPECDKYMFGNNYDDDGGYPSRGVQEYERGRGFTAQVKPLGNGPSSNGREGFVPVHAELSTTRSAPLSDIRTYDRTYNVSDNRTSQSVAPGRSNSRVLSQYTCHFKQYSNNNNNKEEQLSPQGSNRHAGTNTKSGMPPLGRKAASEHGGELGVNHVTPQSSMMDSGYGTNGESDCNSLPATFHQCVHNNNAYAYRANDSAVSSPQHSRPPYQNRAGHTSFSSSESDPAVSPDCHSSPKPRFESNAPSIYQILSACHVFCVQLKLIPDQPIDGSLSLTEISVTMPVLACDLSKSTTPKGNYAFGLGGPGSAFKRVKKNTKAVKKYSFVSIDWVASACLPSGGHLVLKKEDLLIEVNGSPVTGWSVPDVVTLIADVCGPCVEMVIARRKPSEVNKPLPTEISKLRQQCSYLLSEVKNRDRGELKVFSASQDSPEDKHASVGGGEVTQECRRSGERSAVNMNVNNRDVGAQSGAHTRKVLNYDAEHVDSVSDSAVNSGNFRRSLDLTNGSGQKGEIVERGQMYDQTVGYGNKHANCDSSTNFRGERKSTEDTVVQHTVYQRSMAKNAKNAERTDCTVDNVTVARLRHRRFTSPDTTDGRLGGEVNRDDEQPRASDVDLDFSPVISKLCVQTGCPPIQSQGKNDEKLNQRNSVEKDSSSMEQDTVFVSKGNLKMYHRSVSVQNNGFRSSNDTGSQSYTNVYDPNRKIEETQRYIAKTLHTFAPKNRSQEEMVCIDNAEVKENVNGTSSESMKRHTWNVKSAFKWMSNKDEKKQSAANEMNGISVDDSQRIAEDCPVGRSSKMTILLPQNQAKECTAPKQSTVMTVFHAQNGKNSHHGSHMKLSKPLNYNQTGNLGYSSDHNQNITQNPKNCQKSAQNNNIRVNTLPMKASQPVSAASVHNGEGVNGVIRLFNCELGEDEFIV